MGPPDGSGWECDRRGLAGSCHGLGGGGDPAGRRARIEDTASADQEPPRAVLMPLSVRAVPIWRRLAPLSRSGFTMDARDAAKVSAWVR